ncbi:MAG: hypothetical protein KDA89_19655 [Planctomycetaceae bacterium]|nr:hypothetical protein [Planctomycetaceae bacterium]
MSLPHELFQAGKLSEAVSAATEVVRNRPSDVNARSVLCELLCFSGDLVRADKQLEAVMQIKADSAVGVSLIRHLIRSEMCRREVFDQGRVPEFLTQPTESQQLRLQALMALRENDSATAAKLIGEAAKQEPDLCGSCNDQPFEGFCDLDDLLGPMIEVFTATGQYYWLSAEQIVSLEFSGISHLTDMLWRAAEIVTVGDVSGRVHVPALYHNSHLAEDERVRIGRASEWLNADTGGPIRGAGQREWLIGEDVHTITEIKLLTFRQ